MKFSILIPAYNCADTLRSTVLSLMHSGLNDYEILLIDDGSTDATPEVCDSLSEEYTEIRTIHQNNAGVSGARNRGIEEAKGDYILFFDSDDTVDPGTFAGVSELLQQNNPDMLLFGMSFDYYRKGKRYRRDDLICEQEGSLSREEWLPLLMPLFQCNYISPVWNKFIRRDLILENRIQFSRSMHLLEDCLFTMQCLERCNTIYLLPEAIYRYRQAEDEGNAARRLKKIDSLADYMNHFSGLPKEWESVVSSIYFMLLSQKIGASNPKEIAAIAEDHKRSSFAPQSEYDHWLHQQLEEGSYKSLYLRNLKSRTRHSLAVLAKSYGLWK